MKHELNKVTGKLFGFIAIFNCFLFFILPQVSSAQLCLGFSTGTTATTTGVVTDEGAFYQTYGLDFGGGITAEGYCLDFNETGPGISGATFEVVGSVPTSSDGLTATISDLINCFDESTVTDRLWCIWSHTNTSVFTDPNNSGTNNTSSVLILESTSGSYQPLLVPSEAIYGAPANFCSSCTSSTTIFPYTQVDGGSWNATSSVSLAEGSTFQLGTQSGLQSGVTVTLPDMSTDNTADGNTYFTFSNASTSDAGTYTITYTDGSGCTDTQDYTVSISPALPVELTYFSAQISDCTAKLEWYAETEIAFSHYEVQQSVAGKAFETIAHIPGKGGLEGQAYQYSRKVTQQDAYFRLKMVDFDQSVAYSPVRFVAASCFEELVWTAFPNPGIVGQPIQLMIKSPSAQLTVHLINNQGHILQQFILRNTNGKNTLTMALPTTGLEGGIYFIQIVDISGVSKTKKIHLMAS